ncbi:MAG: hypothetical protein JWO79_5101 [Actinomycetia bacterium]|nr:hypothetical protein [Actinomycetes bacterium]MDQ1652452.1 hypothetical protein [Cryptosporangiaceae bacterium]MDQ1659725.1 hypothetical protein [Cryptosporangiaceae bacterium]
MAAVTAAPRRTGSVPNLRILLVTLIAMAIAVVGVAYGSALALTIVGPGAGQASGVHHINDPVPTSFGTVGVEFVRSVDGLTHRALSGATHGVSGLVDEDHAQIQTAVSLTNDLNKPIDFTTKQFRLLVTASGKTTAQAASSGDLPNTRVLPHAGIQGHLSFVVPRSGARLQLEFTDPGSAKPIVIELGNAAFGAQPDTGHSH